MRPTVERGGEGHGMDREATLQGSAKSYQNYQKLSKVRFGKSRGKLCVNEEIIMHAGVTFSPTNCKKILSLGNKYFSSFPGDNYACRPDFLTLQIVRKFLASVINIFWR